MRSLFRVKPIDKLVADTSEPGKQLKRVLGPVQLTFLGVGATIGAGIFSTAGTAAAGSADRLGAGPGLILSFILVAIACAFAALCYAEFAAMVPVAGSAYTYSYATLGEMAAWIIGWDLILEYAVGNVGVAISWSSYFQTLLHGFGIDWPSWLGIDYRSAYQGAQSVANSTDPSTLSAGARSAALAWNEAPQIAGLRILFNLPAFLAVMGLTVLLVRGVRESAGFNTAMVALKIGVIFLFVAIGAFYVQPENWTPFAPNGFKGISGAAAIIFFAYIGFDAVSTAAEECRNPQRDMPIGMIGSLVVCTIVYVSVAIVLTGMVPWNRLGTPEPLADAFKERGLNWTAGLISFGAVLATTSVLLVFQLGQPRILFSMARDGLLPAWAARVHPRFQTPYVTTILTGLFVAFFAGVSNIEEVVELCNIGTLFAFILVAAGVWILRHTAPNQKRPFRTPWLPFVSLAAIACCLFLMFQLPGKTWVRFGIWLGVGLLIYFFYGRSRSRLNNPR